MRGAALAAVLLGLPSAAGAQKPTPTEGISIPQVAPLPSQGGVGPGAVPSAPQPVEGELDQLDPEGNIDMPTQVRIFRQARQRMAEAERQEAQLARQMQRLAALQQDVESRYKALRMLQEELEARLAREEEAAPEERQKAEEAQAAERITKIRKLSQVFEKMKPDEAANLVKAMDEALAVEVLLLVKNRQAAKILGSVDPERAARITERMAQVKRERKK